MKKRILSLALALGLCLTLLTVPAAAAEANTPEEVAALGADLSFSTEVLDFGTAEYREGEDLFPQTLALSVTNHGSEELRYFGWAISSGFPIEVISEEGLTTITISEEAWVVPPGAWVTYPVDARWIMPGDTATFTFKCTLDRVRNLEGKTISLMLDLRDSDNSLFDYDIYYPIAVEAEVTRPDYGNDIAVDKESLEFVYQGDGQTPAPQTVTVTHTGATDLTYVVDASIDSNGGYLDLTLTGGHQESEYTYPNRTYLSPGEQCTLTITPNQLSFRESSNDTGRLHIAAEVSEDEENPGQKGDETILLDISVRFLVEGGGYEIDAWPHGNGTITPSRTYNGYSVVVPLGGSQTFTAAPDEGYMVAAMYVDGENIGRVSSYTFTNVQDNHDVDAVFKEVGWPYWCTPLDWNIWADYDYTDVSMRTVNGTELTVYTYPVGTRFYSDSLLVAIAAETREHLPVARELAPNPGVVYNLSLPLGDTPHTYVILEGEPPADPEPDPQPAGDQPSSWAAPQVNEAIAAGIVPEALQGGYTAPITRAEFCALAVELCETVTGEEITQRASFTDTDDLSVQKMAGLGVVLGTGDGTFNPGGQLTREQAATMLSRLSSVMGHPLPAGTADFTDGASIAAWAVEAVGQMQSSGIMGGTGGGAFTPQGTYTREQSILTILRLYELTQS